MRTLPKFDLFCVLDARWAWQKIKRLVNNEVEKELDFVVKKITDEIKRLVDINISIKNNIQNYNRILINEK